MKNLSRPNVLILYADQTRQDALGCYGGYGQTPNLDRLAEDGAVCRQHIVQNPICMPSRMSFFTGRYPASLGIGTNGIPFRQGDALLLHEVLKPYGYHTGYFGKLHFQPHARRDHRDMPESYGFDRFILSDEPGCYEDAYLKWVEALAPDMVDRVACMLPPAALRYNRKSLSEQPRDTHEPYLFEGGEELTHSAFVASETCRFLRENDSRPFFATAGFYAPHCPVNPPPRFVRQYDPAQMPLPSLGPDEKMSRNLKRFSDADWQNIAAHYYALMSHVDDCIGTIIQTLVELGQLDNTIVIFTSDHGEFLGDHGRVGKSMPGHDCIIKVPCILRYPSRISAGTIIEGITEAVDIMPSILDFCGIQTPPSVQGKTLLPALEDGVPIHDGVALIDSFEPAGRRAVTVRSADFKYSLDWKGKEILYDLNADPLEHYNIAMHNHSLLADARKAMLLKLLEASSFPGERQAEY